MTYTLTAEQMQQVRKAVVKAYRYLCPDSPFRNATQKIRMRAEVIVALYAALALLDAAMQAPEATDPLDRPMGGHLLDSVRYPVLTEATAGGDVREDVLVEGALMMIHHRDRVAGWGDITPRERLRMYGEARGAVRAVLAAAPKPCEQDHGTKPEAPTELCKECGGRGYGEYLPIEGAVPEGCRRFWTCPTCKPKTDATPKDEE